ncbi:BPSS1780 family membrane protein [Marichromatium gracile]|uniref:Uncharacterized protein n=1 Tax=Marichromatium gracile TaxID=1048 RepID=A0ABR5VIU8_MARGR|nr:BPSS1780 family membrane protein [Marichromatium gracile]KXX65604.1 hypothetical protein AY586_09655 [Marichromatium gracile]
MEARYRIVFTGELAPGKKVQTVVPELAAKFRMRKEQAREILLGGAEQTLKHDLPEHKAERYREALEAIGLMVRIERQDAPQETPAAAAPARDERPPMSGATRCPKCGALEVSPVTGVCQACGVVAERYQANQTRPEAADPYAPPQADLTPPPRAEAGDDRLQDPVAVGAGRGWGWVADGWSLFRAQPLPWIGALVLFYLILIVANLVPVVGSLASTVLGPMFTGGLMLGAHAQYRGERFSVAHLFAGFSTRPGPLALIGVLYLVLTIAIVAVIMLLMVGLGLGAAAFTPMTGAPFDPAAVDPMATMAPGVVLGMVAVVALLIIPLVMATLFAPALVAIEGVAVLRAFKLSFTGCLRNLLPFLVYGLVAFGLLILGSIPLMLGLLVVIPLLVIAIYQAYRDIYYG